MTEMAEGQKRRLSPPLRRLYLAEGFSYFGDGVQLVALPTAFVIATGSGAEAAKAIGTFAAISVVSRLLGLLAGGFLADRLAPQRLMAAADLVRVGTVVVLALSFDSGQIDLVTLGACAVVAGVAGGIFTPALQALKQRIIDDDNRVRANSMLSILQTAVGLAAPPAGGLLIVATGPVPGLLLNASTFAISALALIGIASGHARRESARPKAGRGNLIEDAVQGWRDVSSRPWLWLSITSSTAINTVIGALVILANIRVLTELGGPRALGLVAAAEGVGGLLGALAAQRLVSRYPLRVGCLLLALISVTFACYAVSDSLVVIAAGSILGFAGVTYYSVNWDSLLQFHVSPDNLGKVSSWDLIGSYVGTPLGQISAAALAAHYATNAVIGVGALLVAFFSLLPLSSRGVRLLRMRPVDAPG